MSDGIEIIAAFRSRAQTMKLYRLLRDAGVPCAVIDTPREASLGCGISARYAPEYHRRVLAAFSRMSFNSFIGFFRVFRGSNGKTRVEAV